MPPKAETGSQAWARKIGLLQARALGDAAGIGVFDDRHSRRARRVEFRDEFEGGVGVVDIIVGKLLALHLPGGGDARRFSPVM